MGERIRRAERAAEMEYVQVPKSNMEYVQVPKSKNINKEPLQQTVKTMVGISKVSKLRKKRILERKRKKLQTCLDKFVGPAGTVKATVTGEDSKRTFYIKCSECGVVCSKLRLHFMLMHKYSEEQAKFKESELRVMYLWARKGKHGSAKPLPCQYCSTWYLRLDNHLKYKHKELEKMQINSILESTRQEYWYDGMELDTNMVNSRPSHVTDSLKINKIGPSSLKNRISGTVSNSAGAFYVPEGAKMLTRSERDMWDIVDEDFRIFYETPEKLLDAFVEELARKHPQRRAANYRKHLEYIWEIVDPTMQIFPKCALGNSLLVEDRYHNVTVQLVGKGGNEASTLRVRFTALRYFIKFLRRRHVFAGLGRDDFNRILEYVAEWNADFTKMIAQRKIDLRKIKLKRLITPKHMIAYGKSSYIRNLVFQISELSRKKEEKKSTVRFAQKVRDYLITNLCIMNGLRSSNIIELRVDDILEATRSEDYPGYMVFVNSTYKTSTIYGEKVLVLPDSIFVHMKTYVDHLRSLVSATKRNYLFVTADGDMITHGAIGNALTSSFSQADIFSEDEFARVCPTRIRCACATYGCKAEGIDSGFFAKHFMKNKEDTTNIHYNLFANHREALKLAMLMGNTFEVGGLKKSFAKEEIDELTKAINENSKEIPSSEEVLSWINQRNTLDNKELATIIEILDSMKIEESRKTTSGIGGFYGNKSNIDQVYFQSSIYIRNVRS